MFYEDMLHEQENQTCFEIEDAISALPVTLRISNSDEEFWPDCIEIKTPDGDVVEIWPGDALNILKWLEHHRSRLEARRAQQLQTLSAV